MPFVFVRRALQWPLNKLFRRLMVIPARKGERQECGR